MNTKKKEGRNITLVYSWNAIDDFDMPLLINTGMDDFWIYPSLDIKEIKLGSFDEYDFQIRDDLFGYLSYDTGKPSLNDFKQSKITLPLIYSLSQVSSIKKRQIINNLRNYKSIDKIISFVKENKGIEYSQKVMNNLAQKSEEILENFPNSDYKMSLKKLIGYTIKRQA